ncbi:MAG TPA: type II secretion system major pseudopilin GspG [Candidatus Acidoferrum sp.]|nr:type II secretion system major pseudopilin GspG [Candidatus Acidoferrum sp.]
MKIKINKLHGNVAQRRQTGSQGFTLTEIMLVVVIIGILAALVIPKIAGSSERARVTAAQADIKGGIKSAIGQYEVDNGFYPKSLQELIVQPSNAKNWHGPYFDPPKLPVDPWGNPYIYYYPGKHNAASYDLLSTGPDGREGTDDDIGNWMN